MENHGGEGRGEPVRTLRETSWLRRYFERTDVGPFIFIFNSITNKSIVEIYEEPIVEQTTLNDDQAADDRIAEEFRREFMDAVSQRQRKKAGPPHPAARIAAGKKEEEVLKGPKLGGSRTARAAMREAMLKAGKK